MMHDSPRTYQSLVPLYDSIKMMLSDVFAPGRFVSFPEILPYSLTRIAQKVGCSKSAWNIVAFWTSPHLSPRATEQKFEQGQSPLCIMFLPLYPSVLARSSVTVRWYRWAKEWVEGIKHTH